MEIFHITITDFHPLLVHFPIALLCIAFLFDLIGYKNNLESFKNAGWYCQISGVISFIPTIITGLIDNNNNSAGFLEIINLKDLLLVHGIVELFVFLIFIVLLYYRWVRNMEPNASYLFMVFVGLLGMLYGALLGGEYYH